MNKDFISFLKFDFSKIPSFDNHNVKLNVIKIIALNEMSGVTLLHHQFLKNHNLIKKMLESSK